MNGNNDTSGLVFFALCDCQVYPLLIMYKINIFIHMATHWPTVFIARGLEPDLPALLIIMTK